MSIQRWAIADIARMSVVPAVKGDLVTYADHVAIIERLRDTVKHAEYNDSLDLQYRLAMSNVIAMIDEEMA